MGYFKQILSLSLIFSIAHSNFAFAGRHGSEGYASDGDEVPARPSLPRTYSVPLKLHSVGTPPTDEDFRRLQRDKGARLRDRAPPPVGDLGSGGNSFSASYSSSGSVSAGGDTDHDPALLAARGGHDINNAPIFSPELLPTGELSGGSNPGGDAKREGKLSRSSSAAALGSGSGGSSATYTDLTGASVDGSTSASSLSSNGDGDSSPHSTAVGVGSVPSSGSSPGGSLDPSTGTTETEQNETATRSTGTGTPPRDGESSPRSALMNTSQPLVTLKGSPTPSTTSTGSGGSGAAGVGDGRDRVSSTHSYEEQVESRSRGSSGELAAVTAGVGGDSFVLVDVASSPSQFTFGEGAKGKDSEPLQDSPLGMFLLAPFHGEEADNAQAPFPPQGRSSINNRDEGYTDKDPLLGNGSRHSRYDGAAGKDEEEGQAFSPLPTKVDVAFQILQELIEKDLNESAAVLESWITSKIEANADFLNKPVRSVLQGLMRDYKDFLPDDFKEEARAAVKAFPTNPTMEEFLNHYGLMGSSSAAEEQATFTTEPKLYKQLRYLLNLEVGIQLFQKEMDEDPELRAFLKHFDQVTVKRKFNRKQWALGVFSLFVAAGNAITQGTIFAWGVRAFFDKVGAGKSYDGQAPVGLAVSLFTTFISFLDSIPRDWDLFTQLGEPNDEEFVQHKKGWIAKSTPYGLAVFAATLAAYYFYDPESSGAKYAATHTGNGNPTSYWIWFGSLVGFLALDAGMAAKVQIQEAGGVLKKRINCLKRRLEKTWLGTTWLQPYLHIPEPPEIERQRADVVQSLEELKEVIFHKDAKANKALRAALREGLGRGDNKNLSPLDAEATIKILLHHIETENAEDDPRVGHSVTSHDWRERVAAGVGTFVATAASFARYAAYYYIMNAFLGAMGVDGTALEILSNFLGFIGFSIQGFVEQHAMEDNIKSMGKKEAHSKSSHPTVRKVVNGISMGMGGYFTLPYLVLGWLALKKYSFPVQVGALTPYLFADGHSNYWNVKDTYGAYVPKCDQDRNIDLLDGLIGMAERAHPHIIVKLSKRLKRLGTREENEEGAPL